MPTWTVKLRVNVPGQGDMLVEQAGVEADDLAAAVKKAIETVSITPTEALLNVPEEP